MRRAGVDKGTATRWLADYHGLSVSDVVAVGDWINDVPMFAVAGKSFAMAQAPEDVYSAATFRLKASQETGGGIREAAERAGLL